jgi:phage shock protein PspC (stress-responsive transcriptional regulator)
MTEPAANDAPTDAPVDAPTGAPTGAPATVTAEPPPQTARLLRRRADRRLLGGVCGGVADYTGLDVALIRILAVGLTFIGGAGFAMYAAAWLLVPVEGTTRSLAERLLGR